MDLWFDPSRQVIIDKNDWERPYWFFWFLSPIWWWFPERLIANREGAWAATYLHRNVVGGRL